MKFINKIIIVDDIHNKYISLNMVKQSKCLKEIHKEEEIYLTILNFG